MLTYFVFIVEAADTKGEKATKASANGLTRGPFVADAGALTRRQAAIWLPIGMLLIVIGAVFAIYRIDDVKSRDTILYAKFIANLKDKQN